MSLDQNIKDVLQLQDVELANAMGALKGDPAKLSDFLTARKGELYNSVTAEHSDNFQKVYNDYVRASEGTKQILYYHVRNKDLDQLQDAVFSRAKGEADAATHDSQNAKRQFEINEWTAGNKRDTLFFLQLLFIVLAVTVPLLYASKTGLAPQSVVYGITGLLGIAVVLTLIIRWQYTQKSRDLRYWNRRRFAQMGGPPTAPTCEAVTGLVNQGIAQAQATYDKGQQMAQNAETRLGNAFNALTA
jgi:hypothetical protein